MSRSHDPFSAALASLSERLEGGDYPAGAPIVIIDEARRLKLSVTPVREALAWLCGEGLVERAAGGGYLAPRLEPAVVRDRYEFRSICLAAAVTLVAGSRNGDAPPATPPTAGVAAWFDYIIRASGNLALADGYARVHRQLALFRSVEAETLGSVEAEEDALVRALRSNDAEAARRELEAYHQRRMRAAALLLAARDRRSSEPTEIGGAP